MANSSNDDNQKQVTSDDQELAKALAGVNQEAESMTTDEEVAPLPPPVVEPIAPSLTPPPLDPAFSNSASAPAPGLNQPATAPVAADANLNPQLASVKQAALAELRPLIDKLEVGPEEKFNTYLLLIRSTDDTDLIAPAHEAAKAIPDETKKAQALLDIIKEIDFLSTPKQ